MKSKSQSRWSLDVNDERLWDGESAVKLTPKAFQLMLYLALNPKRLITKHEILDAVWSDTNVTEGLVKDYVADLRKALGDCAKEPIYIETVHGRGYRLIGRIYLNHDSAQRSQLPLSSTTPTLMPIATPLVAVLPFVVIGDDERWELLTKGLCADIIYDLSRLADLHVVAYSSSMYYKNADMSAVAIGRELGTNYIVEGSIQAIGDRVKIISNLINMPSGHQLWSDCYECETNDLFELQSSIVERIAVSLSGFHGEIHRAEKMRLDRKHPSNLEAYELYLLAFECVINFDYEHTIKGLEYIEKAISLDPMFARSWIVLGYICNNAIYDMTTDNPSEFARKGREAILRAIELDPRDPMAIIEYGRLCARAGDTVRASDCFERALDIGANNVDACVLLTSKVAFVLDRIEEAKELLERSFALNPNAPQWYYFHSVRLAYFSGEFQAVVDTAKRCKENPETRLFEILALTGLNEHSVVDELIVEFRKRYPDFDLDSVIYEIPLIIDRHIEIYRNGLLKSGLIQSTNKNHDTKTIFDRETNDASNESPV